MKLATAAFALALTPSVSGAQTLKLHCETTGPATISPANLCSVFRDELTEAFPEAVPTTSLKEKNESDVIDLRLLVDGPRGPRLQPMAYHRGHR